MLGLKLIHVSKRGQMKELPISHIPGKQKEINYGWLDSDACKAWAQWSDQNYDTVW